jgi:hypothetical protein
MPAPASIVRPPVAAVDQQYPDAAAHQAIGGRHADHAAADHDRVVACHFGVAR